jgi:hypothetical protein
MKNSKPSSANISLFNLYVIPFINDMYVYVSSWVEDSTAFQQSRLLWKGAQA